MGIRFVPDYTNYVSLIASDQQQANTLLQQLSSGRRLTSPSDDPIATAQLVENQTELDQNDHFTRSVQGLQAQLQTADSSLNTVVNSLTRAISLGTQGANGGLSDSERKAMATEVDSLKQQVMAQANTTYQGSYIFAGTATNNPPYVANPASPSGVSYVGNTATNQVEVTPGQLTTVNQPGSTVFGGGADVFQALSDLSTALNSNGDVSAATTEVQNAFSNVNQQRTFYSNTLSQLTDDATNLGQQNLTLTQTQTNLAAANLPAVATALSQAEVTLNAAYSAFSRISQNSLISYLK